MDDRHFATWPTVTVAGFVLFISVLLLVIPLKILGGWLPMPFLPLIVIFVYGLERPASLPPQMSFAAGLLQDLLFGVALGPWASVYLLVHALIIWQRSYFAGRDIIVLTTGFGLACLGASLVYWLEMSILLGRMMPLFTIWGQGLVTVLAFPAALLVFRQFAGRQRPSLVA